MKKHKRVSRAVLLSLVGLVGVSSLQAYAGSIVINLPPQPKPQPQPKKSVTEIKKLP